MDIERWAAKLGSGFTGLILLGAAAIGAYQSLEGQKNGMGGEFVLGTSAFMATLGIGFLGLAIKL